MKKLIALAVCLVLGTSALAGCSDSCEPFEVRSHTADAPISAINLDVPGREIEVALSRDEQNHIQYFENSRE